MTVARLHRRQRPRDLSRGGRVEWSLEPADTAAIPRLRQRIMRLLGRQASRDADLAASEVVVAELLTNALAHTAGKAWVSLRWDGTHPLLSVADLGPGFPTGEASAGAGASGGTTIVGPRPPMTTERSLVAQLPEDPLADGGRGLYLVAHLALDVAVVTRSTGGSVVSVTLNLHRASDDQVESREPLPPAPRIRLTAFDRLTG
jgi:anti-sigma regulatory factor (Ser/Thr protein kinase)